MHVFITGATGYVGSHLVQSLVNSGHIVHALVRSVPKARLILPPQAVVFEGDLDNISAIESAMEGCEIVYHLAAFAKVYSKDTSEYFRINCSGTKNILLVAKMSGVKRVIVTSTAGVFGPSIDGIINEHAVRKIDFFNEYESSKALSELIAREYCNKGLDVVILSPTRIYGPFLHGDSESITLLIEKFIKTNWKFIPGDGSKIGNYVFIDDVVQAHINAMTKGQNGELYLIGGENKTYDDFFSMLKKVSGIKRRMFHVPDAFQTFCAKMQMIKTWFGREPLITTKWTAKGKYDWEVDCRKAWNELNLNPIKLEDGLKKTAEWIKRH
ncbi:MAG: NAD-dependent epimerase/dehydratase family protein [Crocinitomicaceae bacterium]|nr:NAD-dependent epimerase/dehydratase family protein [Crocinitomicaceae bacterium]